MAPWLPAWLTTPGSTLLGFTGNTSIDWTTPGYKQILDKVTNQRRLNNGQNPNEDTSDPTWQESVVAQLKDYDPLIAKGLVLGGVGVLAYLLMQEAQGKQTILSKMALSPTANEFVKGSFDFLSNVAKASVSAPGLRLLSAFALVELMKKAGLTNQASGAWIMAGVTAIEGVNVVGDFVSGFVPSFGSNKTEGPTTLSYTDARTVMYGPQPTLKDFERAKLLPA